MHLPKKALLSAALLTSCVASLTACGGSDGPADGSAAGTKKDSWVSDQQEWADQQAASSFVVGLSGTAKWHEGLTARLSGFTRRRVTEDDTTMLDDGQPYLTFKVTVTNGTRQVLDMKQFNMVCPADSDQVLSDSVDGAPGNHLLAGDTVTWTAGCTFEPKQTRLQLEFTPPLDERTGETAQTAIFSGTVPAE
ncbi:hypothetical protein [Streptomyces sp. NPDC059575]|uniref:hypothetical protein n=1 Tax=Streptomyces sp. NPDC059575 TaxID=3346872 RepID=UPI0036BE7DCA